MRAPNWRLATTPAVTPARRGNRCGRKSGSARAQIRSGFEHFFLEIHEGSCAASQQYCAASY